MRFFVQGEPVPKGSTHSFKHKTTGAIITMATNAKEPEHLFFSETMPEEKETESDEDSCD